MKAKNIVYPSAQDAVASMCSYDCCSQREFNAIKNAYLHDATRIKYVTTQCTYFVSPQLTAGNSFTAMSEAGNVGVATEWWEFQMWLHAWCFGSQAMVDSGRPKIMPSRAILFYTPVPRQQKNWRYTMEQLELLRHFGIHIEWTSAISETDPMFEKGSGIKRSSVFGRGLPAMIATGAKAIRETARVIYPTKTLSQLTKDESLIVTEEAICQMNAFADMNTYKAMWRAKLRPDWAELIEEHTYDGN